MIDLHCDTIAKLAEPLHKGNLLQNSYSVDVERLERAGGLVQCFSTFFMTGWMPERRRPEMAYRTEDKRIDCYNENIRQCEGRILPVHGWEDVQRCIQEKKVGGLLTMEDSVPVGGSLEKLRHFYERGIRLITIIWNYENAAGFPNSRNQETMLSGLKPFGFEMLEEMNRLGIIVDVSHLSDGGFWDVARHSKKPFIASHSNCRSLTLHPRNLTDAMIKEVADKGGVVGLNFCPAFLGSDNKSRISDMLRHIKHMYEVGGEDVLALGTDFDGISGTLQIDSCDKLDQLKEALRMRKMPERIIDKMWQDNALRVFREIL